MSKDNQTIQKNSPAVFTCPIPQAFIPFLDNAKVKYSVSQERTALSNYVTVDLELTSGLDIASIIYAAWAHGMDDNRNYLMNSYKSKSTNTLKAAI